MARRGSWTGLGGIGALTLDPFGGSRGGLGRYNVGDTLASLEAAERYAIAVGWQNGTVSDEDYIASLKKAIDMAPEGSRERITAQDNYDDAVYTIGRNKLVRDVNNAATDSERIGAYQALIAYDQKRLKTMVTDNEQRRELVDRINGSKADIRSTRWSQLVRAYNENKTSNQRLLDFAKSALKDAQGAPDQQTWEERVYEFSQRIADEHLAQLQQDYEHDRIDGSKVLAYVQQRMKGMSPDSPRYAELQRYAEDFAKSWHADEAAKEYAAKYDSYQEGTLSDDQWLHYLHQRVQDAPAGSDEKRAAKHDLVMETFRVTENRLVYEVQVNGASPNTLIRFYQTALATMDHNSARALDLAQKISDLKKGQIDSINLYGQSTGAGPGINYGHYVGGNALPANTGGGGKSAADSLVAAAANYLGMRYNLGAEGQNGIDCSGLVYAAFKDAGLGSMIDGQRRLAQGYTNMFANNGQFTRNRSELQRGDLVVYGDGKRVTHIGIYLGNGKVMSALTTSGVTIHRINGLDVQVKGFLLMDWSQAPANFNPPASIRRPARSQQPNRRGVGPAPDDSPEVSAKTRGVNTVPQVDPGLPGNVPPLAIGEPQASTASKPASTVKVPRQAEEPYAGTQGTRSTTTVGATTDNGNLDNLPGAVRDIAQRLVQGLGGNANNEQSVRAMAAWLMVENGQNVSGNNPFHLAGMGLPGQLGNDGNGLAIFDTLDRGINAAVIEIKNHYPEIANAFARGNAQDALSRVEKSNWRAGGYDNTLAAAYNSTGPTQIIIGGASKVFDTPQSLASLAHTYPGIASLFDVDPTDPAQAAWFAQNLDNLRAAYNRYDPTGQRAPGQWQYVAPDGKTINLSFSPDMYFDMLDAKAQFQTLPNQKLGGDALSTHKEVNSLRFDVTLEGFTRQNEQYQKAISDALGRGNLPLAYQLSQDAYAAAYTFAGLDPRTDDLTSAAMADPSLTPEQLADIQRQFNSVKPWTSDNNDGNILLGMTDNERGLPPSGKPIIDFAPGSNVPQIDADYAYFHQVVDPATHEPRLELVTWYDHPGEFAESPDWATAETGAPGIVPAYRNKFAEVNVPGYGVPIQVPTEATALGLSMVDPNVPYTFRKNLNIDISTFGGTAVAGPQQPAPPAEFGVPWLAGAEWLPEPGPTPQPINTRLGTNPEDVTTKRAYAERISTRAGHPALVRQANGSIPAEQMSFYDPSLGKYVTAYSFDGFKSPSAEWIIRVQGSDTDAPRPVLNADVLNRASVVDGELQILDKNDNTYRKYDRAKDGPLSTWVHWYGTLPSDVGRETISPSARKVQGTPDSYMPVLQMVSGKINLNNLNDIDQVALRTGLSPYQIAQFNARRDVDVERLALEGRQAQQARTIIAQAQAARAALPGAPTAQTPRLSGSIPASQTRFMAVLTAQRQAQANRALAATTAREAAAAVPRPAATTPTPVPKVRPTPAPTPSYQAPAPKPAPKITLPTTPKVVPHQAEPVAPRTVTPKPTARPTTTVNTGLGGRAIIE